METLINEHLMTFCVGFGMASILAFGMIQRYFSMFDKLEKMLHEFKSEGQNNKWLK